MSFAVPLFLLATVAGAIPVVLHLIHRQKAREVPFPTLRFLRLSVERTRRRKYVDDLALLLVRVAILVLVAVGLARPILHRLGVRPDFEIHDQAGRPVQACTGTPIRSLPA